jgi:hypothetical protein
MDPGARRAIAYIAGRLCTGSDAGGVLDLETGKHAEYEGRVDDEIAVYDHSRNCLVGGQLPELFDGGTHAAINLELSDDSFTGFDHDSNHYFGGRAIPYGAETHEVWIFDCAAGRRSSYVLADPAGTQGSRSMVTS